ncbi:early nodulin-75-like [Limulus polyphemus]|uniref:Early nodulin-75-like n=1 Tax=Limulus polyphemus TaxID=6850 RepID=A0ABM1B4X3_LIMPO|nr:early nodulin-75-like [Limulus polyphemus]XP_022242036.1 early nodulin-75-like [Limulus polyphemus]XP_022242037.1 early nodulin-75-like [Limulus polyphemus]
MKLSVCIITLIGAFVAAEERVKRQSRYPTQDAVRYPPPQGTVRHPPSQAVVRHPPPQDAVNYPPPQAGGHQNKPIQQYRPPPSGGAPVDSRPSSRGRPKVRKPSQQSLRGRVPQEEEPTTPDPLSVLLGNSKFGCSDKHDGYYADDSVNCKVFHYCVGGSKHSWLCPKGTVFHQVHLNCVPSSQDICSQSEKYHLVNDYLYKPLEEKGPNNTLRYHQRYYPEKFLYGGRAPPHPAPQQVHSAPEAQGYADYDYSSAPASTQYEQERPPAQSPPPRGPASYDPPRQSSPARRAPPRTAPSPQKPYNVGSYKPSSSSGQYGNFPEPPADFQRVPNTRRASSSDSGATYQQGNSYGSPSGSGNSQQYAGVKYDNY